MRIFSRSTLIAFWKSGHAGSCGPLKAWIKEVDAAAWAGPSDVKAQFSTASFLGNNRVVFNIGGNNYRLIVRVCYAPYFAVYVCFIGTHAEYNKVDAFTVEL